LRLDNLRAEAKSRPLLALITLPMMLFDLGLNFFWGRQFAPRNTVVARFFLSLQKIAFESEPSFLPRPLWSLLRPFCRLLMPASLDRRDPYAVSVDLPQHKIQPAVWHLATFSILSVGTLALINVCFCNLPTTKLVASVVWLLGHMWCHATVAPVCFAVNHEFVHAFGCFESRLLNLVFYYLVFPMHGLWEFAHTSTLGHLMIHHKHHAEPDYYSVLWMRRDSVINYYVFGVGRWLATDLLLFVPHCLKYGLYRPLKMWCIEVPKAAAVLCATWWALGGWMIAGMVGMYVVATWESALSIYQHLLWDKDGGDDHYFKGVNTLMVPLHPGFGEKHTHEMYWMSEKVHFPYEPAEMVHGAHHVAPTIKNFAEQYDGKLLRGLPDGTPVMNHKLTFLIDNITLVTFVTCGKWQELVKRCTHNLHCAPEDRLPAEFFQRAALHCF